VTKEGWVARLQAARAARARRPARRT
jgi:hypothetical protein